MKWSRGAWVWAVLLIQVNASLAGFAASSDSAAAASARRKIQHIEANGRLQQPDQTATELTESEINAYMASGDIRLPQGVRSVHFACEPRIVNGTARVDFDELRAGRGSSNPLLAVFSGLHEVIVVARAHGAMRRGFVNVDSVSLDGVEIPRFVLQLFVEKFLQPKYPGIGSDSEFPLPDRIDTATVGLHKLTIVQK